MHIYHFGVGDNKVVERRLMILEAPYVDFVGCRYHRQSKIELSIEELIKQVEAQGYEIILKKKTSFI